MNIRSCDDPSQLQKTTSSQLLSIGGQRKKEYQDQIFEKMHDHYHEGGDQRFNDQELHINQKDDPLECSHSEQFQHFDQSPDEFDFLFSREQMQHMLRPIASEFKIGDQQHHQNVLDHHQDDHHQKIQHRDSPYIHHNDQLFAMTLAKTTSTTLCKPNQNYNFLRQDHSEILNFDDFIQANIHEDVESDFLKPGSSMSDEILQEIQLKHQSKNHSSLNAQLANGISNQPQQKKQEDLEEIKKNHAEIKSLTLSNDQSSSSSTFQLNNNKQNHSLLKKRQGTCSSVTLSNEFQQNCKEESRPLNFGIQSKCKMDVGYKKFLRCVRKAIKNWFNEWCPTSELARYKWNKKPNKEERWFQEAGKFLQEEVVNRDKDNDKMINKKPLQILSELNIWQTVFLIQPTLGKPFYAGAKKKEIEDEKVYIIDEKLGDDGVLLFRGIFDKNNHEQVKKFFAEPIIRRLWPGILRFFTEEVYNKDSQKEGEGSNTTLDFTETNCKITKHFIELFNLPLPGWWIEKYPSIEISLSEKRLRKSLQKGYQFY